MSIAPSLFLKLYRPVKMEIADDINFIQRRLRSSSEPVEQRQEEEKEAKHSIRQRQTLWQQLQQETAL